MHNELENSNHQNLKEKIIYVNRFECVSDNPETKGELYEKLVCYVFGGGVRYLPTERLRLYLGGRGLLTFVNSEIKAHSGSKGSYVRR